VNIIIIIKSTPSPCFSGFEVMFIISTAGFAKTQSRRKTVSSGHWQRPRLSSVEVLCDRQDKAFIFRVLFAPLLPQGGEGNRSVHNSRVLIYLPLCFWCLGGEKSYFVISLCIRGTCQDLLERNMGKCPKQWIRCELGTAQFGGTDTTQQPCQGSWIR